MVAAGAAALLANPDALRPRLEQEVARATGRALTLGRLRLRLLPVPTLVADGAALANLPGGSAPAMLTARAVSARVRLWPLLRGRVALVLHLDAPRLLIERTASGDNWVFSPVRAPAAASTAPAAPSAPRGEPRVWLAAVDASDGVLSWRYRGAGRARDTELGITTLLLSQDAPDAPLTASAMLTHGGTVTADAVLPPLAALGRAGGGADATPGGPPGGAGLPLRLRLASAGARGELEGTLGPGAGAFRLRLTLDAPALERLRPLVPHADLPALHDLRLDATAAAASGEARHAGGADRAARRLGPRAAAGRAARGRRHRGPVRGPPHAAVARRRARGGGAAPRRHAGAAARLAALRRAAAAPRRAGRWRLRHAGCRRVGRRWTGLGGAGARRRGGRGRGGPRGSGGHRVDAAAAQGGGAAGPVGPARGRGGVAARHGGARGHAPGRVRHPARGGDPAAARAPRAAGAARPAPAHAAGAAGPVAGAAPGPAPGAPAAARASGPGALLLHDLRVESSAGDLTGEAALRPGARPVLDATLTGQTLDADALLAAWRARPPAAGAPAGPAASSAVAPPSAATPPGDAPEAARGADPARTDASSAAPEGSVPRPVARGAAPPARARLADVALPLGGLRRGEGDVSLSLSELRWGGEAWHDVAAHAVLAGGTLVLDPVAAQAPAGALRGRLSLQAGPPPGAAPAPALAASPAVAVALSAPALQLAPLLAALGHPGGAEGHLAVDAQLSGTGGDTDALLASLDGHLALTVVDGAVSDRLLEALFGASLRAGGVPVLFTNGETAVRCLALRLEATHGMARLPALALDSSRLTLTGEGTLDGRDQTLDLQLHPLVRLGPEAVGAPLRVTGPWLAPRARLDASLGGLSLGAASARPDPCPGALATARAGAPGPLPAPAKAERPADLLRRLFR